MEREKAPRINISISPDLLERIDAYAKSVHVNRTSAICVLLSQALSQNDGIDALKAVSVLMAKMDVKKMENE